MATFDIYEDKAGEYRWRLKSGDDIIADSGEGYSNKSGAKDAVDRIKRDGPDASVLDLGTPHYEVFEDKAGEYRWRLVSGNGRIVADSGEGYSSKSGARDAVKNVQQRVGDADTDS